MAREFNVFISHSWSYHDDLLRLRNLLSTRGYFHVDFYEASYDTPINSINASYIKQALKKKITDSDIVLVIAGVYATHSEWIGWELETAYKNNVPIVGVVPFGAERMSTVVKDYADEIVRWNTESIVEAIRFHAA